ncbi:hypothetical protein FACS189476_09530 [Spirochaetia bacterium]|nr:hypothetical protein FACS189476_09530 [Spirochaetia bacterium]
MIDRQRLVTRHNPVYTKPEKNAPAGITKADLADKLQAALDAWELFMREIDPRPFLDTDKDGLAPDPDDPTGAGAFRVHSSGKINNGGTAPIVIHRYWPADIPTRTAWNADAVVEIRQAAFKKAVADIEAMIAAIDASPFSGEPSLQDIRNAMENVISYNPPLEDCRPREGIIWSGGTANFDQTEFLYEYYLGYIPAPGEYAQSGGPLPFPE